jgi:hypothetical protein
MKEILVKDTKELNEIKKNINNEDILYVYDYDYLNL